MTARQPTSEARPAHRWDKMKWVREHLSEVCRDYPDQWVCVVEGEVVAAGAGGYVEDVSRAYSPERSLVLFAEGDAYVYFSD